MTNSREIIAERRDVRFGSNGFYDIRLIRQSRDALLIEVELSVFFRFIPFGGNPRITWNQAEQDFFVAEWLRQIPAAWNQQNHTTINNRSISIAFICSIRNQPDNTQWQANVMKLESRNAFRTSAVWLNNYPENYDAQFDSNDDLLKSRERRQTAMIHEFGHMIGNPDEYKSDSPHLNDKNSIMNIGAEVRERHLAHFVRWARMQVSSLINGNEFKSNFMKAVNFIKKAETKEEEIEAVQAWLDEGGPEETVYFVVKRRDTKEEIPIDEISLYKIEELEVEFKSDSEEEGEVIVWEPKSLEALELLMVE